jgi:hypothetical protein
MAGRRKPYRRGTRGVAGVSFRFEFQTAAKLWLRNPAARCARVFARNIRPKKRAQGRPDARCTRGLACKMHLAKRTRAYRSSGGNPTFPAQWFYGLLRALLGDEFLLSPSPADWDLPKPGWAGASPQA